MRHHIPQRDAHGNERDRGVRAMLRYARQARSMWRSPINDAVVARIAPTASETVVDIGAGVGAGTFTAARTNAAVVPVEPTPYMRRLLSWRRLSQRCRDRIRIVDGTAEATTLDDESADAVWAVNSMHHWTDPSAAAHELARILRPGGRLLLVDEDMEDRAHPHSPISGRGADDHLFDMVDVDAIAALLCTNGLTASACRGPRLADTPTLVIDAFKPDHHLLQERC